MQCAGLINGVIYSVLRNACTFLMCVLVEL